MPLVMFARLAGRNEFDTWGHLSADPTLGVRYADGRADELTAAAERVRACRTLVLDVTALITLATLDLLPVLSRAGRRFVVPQAAYEEVRGLLEDTEQDDTEDRGDLLLTGDGRLAIVPKAAGQRERFLGLQRAVCDAARMYCAVTRARKRRTWSRPGGPRWSRCSAARRWRPWCWRRPPTPPSGRTTW